MDKLGRIRQHHWEERLILFDVGKFVSPTKQTCTKFSDFEEQYLDCKIKQKVWNEAENRERDWGETLKIPTGV